MLTHPFSPDCFYAIDLEILDQSIGESEILHEMEMGGGVVIYHGTRYGRPVWLMKNPQGLCAAWYDDTPESH